MTSFAAMRKLEPTPLDRAAYLPFGDVVMAEPAGGANANQGTATRFNRQASLENLRPGGAAPNVAVFRCAPRAVPCSVRLLEKHPLSTQLFVPMCVARYLVVVALGGDAPDLASARAFMADGEQGISYRPGVWHSPLLALDREALFTCLIWEANDAADCVEHLLDGEDAFVIEV